jgi:DNA-binding NarL/FixJ family response regulator
LRSAVYDLRIDQDRERRFPDALRELVEVHRAMATKCEVVAEIPDELPARTCGRRGSDVLHIIGEALTNARRHGAATRIVVHVKSSKTRLSVEISDDGRGFDAVRRPVGVHRQGLKGMRERADLLDARLDVRSDHTGTTVRLDVDLGPQRPTKLTRVLLVEDHAAVRQALAEAFARHADIEVVGQAGSLSEAHAQLEGVDVAVIDLWLPDGYGPELIGDLRKANRQAQALVLTATDDRREIARAVACGAGGVLHKTTYLDDVVAAIRRLRAVETLLSLQETMKLQRFAAAQRERERDDRSAIGELTPREREILQALADGLNSRQIADQLYISIRTARNHINSILSKLGVHSQIQALLLALRYEIVTVPPVTRFDPPDE